MPGTSLVYPDLRCAEITTNSVEIRDGWTIPKAQPLKKCTSMNVEPGLLPTTVGTRGLFGGESRSDTVAVVALRHT